MRISTILTLARRIADSQDRPVLLVEGTMDNLMGVPDDLRSCMKGEVSIIETDTLDELYETAERIKDVICPPGTPFQSVDLPDGHDILLRIIHQNGAVESFEYNLLVSDPKRRGEPADAIEA